MFKRVFTTITCCALVAAAAIALVGCEFNLPGTVKAKKVYATLQATVSNDVLVKDGTLTVGVNASDTPYAGTNSSNEIVGYTVDLATALAQKMGLKVDIVDVSNDGKSAVMNKKVDIAIGVAKSGTSKTVTYTDAFVDDGVSVYCLRKNDPGSVDAIDVNKSKFLVQDSTTAAYEMEALVGSSGLTVASTMQEAFDALEAGKADYLVADAVIGDYFARNYQDIICLGFTSQKEVSPKYAVMLTRNTELVQSIQDAWEYLQKGGEFRVIAQKWMGEQGVSILPQNLDVSTLPKSFGKN